MLLKGIPGWDANYFQSLIYTVAYVYLHLILAPDIDIVNWDGAVVVAPISTTEYKTIFSIKQFSLCPTHTWAHTRAHICAYPYTYTSRSRRHQTQNNTPTCSSHQSDHTLRLCPYRCIFWRSSNPMCQEDILKKSKSKSKSESNKSI